MNARKSDPAAGDATNLREVLFELSAVGNSVKVCAVDPVSLVEATIIGPVSAGEYALKRAALQKLRFILAKRAVADPSADDNRRSA